MDNREKLVACLKALGIEPSVGTLSERKKMQKIVYLLERFGVSLGFSSSFSWYIYGPYSPSLTQTLFDIKQNPPKAIAQLSKVDKERTSHLREFLGKEMTSADKIELMASLDFIMSIGKKQGVSDDDIIKAFKQRKTFYTDDEIAAAWAKLDSLNKS